MEFQAAVRCISCNSTKRRKVFHYNGYQSIRFDCYICRRCGLRYASPQPVINEQSLNEIYNSDYYKNYFGDGDAYSLDNSPKNQTIALRLEKEFTYYSSFLDDLHGRRYRVLDIGCGDGRFLTHFHTLGWHCFGIEPSDFAADLARKRNITVLDQHVLELDPQNTFDFIFLDNVIEHLDHPADYLKKINQLLNRSGVFVLKTPNSTGLLERTETLLLSIIPRKIVNYLMKVLHQKLKKGSGAVHRYGNLHPPVHLSIFNKKSIIMALQAAGFRQHEITTLRGSEFYHLWRTPQPPVKGFFNKLVNTIKKTGDFLGKGEMLVAIVKKS